MKIFPKKMFVCSPEGKNSHKTSKSQINFSQPFSKTLEHEISIKDFILNTLKRHHIWKKLTSAEKQKILKLLKGKDENTYKKLYELCLFLLLLDKTYVVSNNIKGNDSYNKNLKSYDKNLKHKINKLFIYIDSNKNYNNILKNLLKENFNIDIKKLHYDKSEHEYIDNKKTVLNKKIDLKVLNIVKKILNQNNINQSNSFSLNKLNLDKKDFIFKFIKEKSSNDLNLNKLVLHSKKLDLIDKNIIEIVLQNIKTKNKDMKKDELEKLLNNNFNKDIMKKKSEKPKSILELFKKQTELQNYIKGNSINRDASSDSYSQQYFFMNSNTHPQEPNIFNAFLKASLTNQVKDAFLYALNNNAHRLTVKLHPPELGSLVIVLKVHNKDITAHIRTEDQKVSDFIKNNINSIEEALNKQGFKLQRIEIKTSLSFEGHFNNFGNKDNAHYKQGQKREEDREKIERLHRLLSLKDDELAQIMLNERREEKISLTDQGLYIVI